VPSLPEKETLRAWLYHAFESGARLAVPLTAGAVSSYLNPTAPVAVLPALSRQLPETAAPALSGPL
jgi:hypothetical protein